MQNPLIEFKESLKNNKAGPLFSGLLKREAYRTREEIKLAKDALSEIEKQFPKLFHSNPHTYTNFAHDWKLYLFPSMPKCCLYQSFAATGSFALMKMPPISVTLLIDFFSALVFVGSLHPSTASCTNSNN